MDNPGLKPNTGNPDNSGRAAFGSVDRSLANETSTKKQRARRRQGDTRQPASSEIIPFNFSGLPIRTIIKNDEVWFIAADVCAVLDLANSRDTLGRLAEGEKGVATTDTPGGPQTVNTVSESGLYGLAFTSRKEEAKAFRQWVTGTVLPQIRRTGQYRPATGPTDTYTYETLTGEASVILPSYGRFTVVYAPNGIRVCRALSTVDRDFVSRATKILCHQVRMIEELWNCYMEVSLCGQSGWDGKSHDRLRQHIAEAVQWAAEILEGFDRPEDPILQEWDKEAAE